MNSALILGVDAYRTRPLTSAVRDALAFRNLLLELNLVPQNQIRLLTSPRVPEALAEAGSSEILEELDNVYRNGEGIDRFFFFFAGHGVLAYSNAAQTRTRTTLLPVDVEDLEKHGRRLIDFDELYQTLSQTGPQQQFYFLDACRDMPYEKQPIVAELGFSGVQPGAARRQACLFAVSPLGQAKSTQGGMGEFTSHLLDGMRGKGLALDFDPLLNKYVITMESLHSHVEERTIETLRKEPLWKRYFQAPQLRTAKPGPDPLMALSRVDARPLTVHIDPDEAARDTRVTIAIRGYSLPENFCYPLNRNHDTVRLQPQQYVVEASSTIGSPDPAEAIVDVRRTSEHTIRILSPRLTLSAPAPAPPPAPEVHPSAVSRAAISGLVRDESGFGVIEASAMEPQVLISVRAIEAPYAEWSGSGSLHLAVPAGPYRVDFRLGTDVFSQSDVYVKPGSQLSVSAKAAMTPLLSEAMATPEIPQAAVLSESIGPMQSGLLATVLPIVGIKVFDRNRELFKQFKDLIEPHDPIEFDDMPFSFVLAADGHGWPIPVEELLNKAEIRVIAPNSESQSIPWHTLSRGTFSENDLGLPAAGLRRIRLAFGRAPATEFFIRIAIPTIGTLATATAALPERATVLSLVVRPDGTLDFNQNLLRLPGRPFPPEQAVFTRFGQLTYGRLLRLLQIGQKLYRSGELVELAMRDGNQDEIMEGLNFLLYGKWVDPLLGCMGYLASRRARLGTERQAAYNLWGHFQKLPDARVIYGLEFPEYRQQIYRELLDSTSIPLLLECAQILADFAVEAGLEKGAPVVESVRRSTPGQPWSQVLLPGPESARAAGTNAAQTRAAEASA